MAGTATFVDRLLLLLLLISGSSHLAFLNAIPISRIRSLHHNFYGYEVSQRSIMEESVESYGGQGRIDLDVNDYPGSGANNRHTPKPQLGRGCTDNC